MAIAGYIGTRYEIVNKKTNKYIYYGVVLLFGLIACLRITQVKDLGDMGHYITYFVYDIDTYFEIGYVYLTKFIKLIFGYSPYGLLIFICVWNVIFLYIASLICRKYEMEKCSGYLFSFKDTGYCQALFFFAMLYWGAFFTWETIRVGLSVSLLFCSTACLIYKKKEYSIVFAVIACLFHTTSIIFLLGIIPLLYIDKLGKKWLAIWFVVILLLRFAFNNIIPISSYVSYVISSDNVFEHYENYDINKKAIGGFSLQDIMYHLFGLAMLLGNEKNNQYMRSVFIYYVGLFIGALFVGISGSMRLQSLFYAMIIFVLYFFILERRYKLSTKMWMISLYATTQIVMTLRQFGWYI